VRRRVNVEDFTVPPSFPHRHRVSAHDEGIGIQQFSVKVRLDELSPSFVVFAVSRNDRRPRQEQASLVHEPLLERQTLRVEHLLHQFGIGEEAEFETEDSVSDNGTVFTMEPSKESERIAVSGDQVAEAAPGQEGRQLGSVVFGRHGYFLRSGARLRPGGTTTGFTGDRPDGVGQRSMDRYDRVEPAELNDALDRFREPSHPIDRPGFQNLRAMTRRTRRPVLLI